MSSWVRAFVAIVALVAAAVVAPAPAHAASDRIGTLNSRHPVLTFSGGVTNPTPLPLVNPPQGAVCVVNCQTFRFRNATNRPFLVSVKDTAGSTNNGWDLYVTDPDGVMVGSADGVGANGQAVAIAPSVHGVYTITVTFTYAYDSTAAYHGEVRTMRGASWKPPATDLPILDAVAPADLHVDGLPPAASTPLGFPIPFPLPTPSSCYADEMVQSNVTRCLRFTTDVHNLGHRLDLKLTFDGQNCTAVQALPDGTEHPAGPCMFHPQHAHFHYHDLVGFALYNVRPDGSIGSRISTGVKESFCLADDDYFGFGTANVNGPRTYVGQPDCSVPVGATTAGVELTEGLTTGWGDVYTWDTPGQFVDISTVKAGHYALVERTNPSGDLLVYGAAERCSATELNLTDSAVTQTAVHPSVTCPPA